MIVAPPTDRQSRWVPRGAPAPERDQAVVARARPESKRWAMTPRNPLRARRRRWRRAGRGSSAIARPRTRRCRVLAAGVWGSAPGGRRPSKILTNRSTTDCTRYLL